MCILAAIAFIAAWLKLFTDFRRYRGLLPSLAGNPYSWIFLLFVAACAFVADEGIKWPMEMITTHEPTRTISIFLCHIVAAGVIVYLSPFVFMLPSVVLGKLPAASGERKVTEMNAVFEAIHQYLDNRTNEQLCAWTDEYDWRVIKFASSMLITDQERSGVLSPTEAADLKSQVAGWRQSADDLEDRERKYEALRGMMDRSCFHDVQTRLRLAAKKFTPDAGAHRAPAAV